MRIHQRLLLEERLEHVWQEDGDVLGLHDFGEMKIMTWELLACQNPVLLWRNGDGDGDGDAGVDTAMAASSHSLYTES